MINILHTLIYMNSLDETLADLVHSWKQDEDFEEIKQCTCGIVMGFSLLPKRSWLLKTEKRVFSVLVLSISSPSLMQKTKLQVPSLQSRKCNLYISYIWARAIHSWPQYLSGTLKRGFFWPSIRDDE